MDRSNRRGRRAAVGGMVAALVLAACSSGDDEATGGEVDDGEPAAASDPDGSANSTAAPGSDPSETSEPAPAVTVEQVAPSPKDDAVVSGLQARLEGDTAGIPPPAVPLDEVRSGGQPPDGIPSIDEPRFITAAEADFLADNEPVLALEIDGDHRAYPVQILIWHEIVNDTVGGIPVAVTYCPLCNSALAYDRRVDDRVLSFGTSGMLWNSALVMYDRQTETLWSHFNAEGIIGEQTGVELEVFPVSTVPWSVWRDSHPDGLVLSRDTGAERPYGSNPYPGYDDINSDPFLFEGDVDGRFTAMTRMVGVELDGEATAVPLTVLKDRPVVPIELAGEQFVVIWEPGTASALDTTDITAGADVGASGVFSPRVDGEDLTFEYDGDEFVDRETGSTWNVLGEAVDGPLEGEQLTAHPHIDTFWFAWSTFQPETDVVE